jgi:hypothetical protein
MRYEISRVGFNNRKRAVECQIGSQAYILPYARVGIARDERVARVSVDRGGDHDALRYVLKWWRRRAVGRVGIVTVDEAFEYYAQRLGDRVRRKLAREAKKRVAASSLGTSPGQFYRLIDEGEDRVSFGQLLALLEVVGADVDVVVT